MKSFLIFCGLLASLSQTSGIRFEKKWSSRPQQNATEICASAPSWTLLPHQSDCRKFYACVNHVAEEFYCAQSKYFDKIQLRCKSGACHDKPTGAAAGCEPHAVSRIAADCSAFSYCSGDGRRSSRGYCPPTSYYHAGYGMCVPISITAAHKCACLLPEHTTLANPDDCETYFVCEKGHAALRQCPRGQYYEAAVSGCLPDLEQKCLMAPTMSAVEAMALGGVCEQAALTGKIFQPVAGNCGKFYLCLQGRVFTKHCAKGFYFDREWNHCRLDVERKCVVELEKVGTQVQDEEEITAPHYPAKKHQKEQLNKELEKKEEKIEENKVEVNEEPKNIENEEKKHEKDNNKDVDEKDQKEKENKKVKKETTTEENKTEENKIEIQSTLPLANNKKKEREVIRPTEKQPEETKQEQKPTPTKTANDKLFSKFIKF